MPGSVSVRLCLPACKFGNQCMTKLLHENKNRENILFQIFQRNNMINRINKRQKLFYSVVLQQVVCVCVFFLLLPASELVYLQCYPAK